MIRAAFTALLLLALTACDTLTPRYVITPEPTTVVVTRQVPTSSEADELLAFFSEVRGLSSRDINHALLEARVGYARAETPLARLRLVTVLAFAREADENEALSLLEPALQDADPHTRARRGYAQMIYGMVTDRRRSRDLLGQMQGRAREGKLEVQAAKAESKALQDRIDHLKQQLDALTSIEKSLATGRK